MTGNITESSDVVVMGRFTCIFSQSGGVNDILDLLVISHMMSEVSKGAYHFFLVSPLDSSFYSDFQLEGRFTRKTVVLIWKLPLMSSSSLFTVHVDMMVRRCLI